MSLASAQLISQLIQANPQAFSNIMASKGMRPPAGAPAAPEPGAMGAGALPTVMPGAAAQPPIGPEPTALPPMDFASLAAGMGPGTLTPDAQAGRAPSPPGASVPGGGAFNPQALAIMAAMMAQPQPQQQSLGALIGGK